MNGNWHEQIQLHLDGHSSAAESAALSEALSRDAELRALYLDYMNLDAALSSLAAAPGAARAPRARWSRSSWRWFAPVAAGVALALIGLLSDLRRPTPTRLDLRAATLSAREAISRLHPDLPNPLPSWMSPTAPLLNGARELQ